MKKFFLSYSTKDNVEVDRFDRELRRRGVQIWRDQYSLYGGRITETAIEEACHNAIGTVFYLTENAAESEWVREKERGYALAAKNARSASVLPIFRDDLAVVRDGMKASAADQRNLDAYDLSSFHGFVVKGDLSEQLKQAADSVLGGLLERLDAIKPPGEPWIVGLVTRGGSKPEEYDPDLLLDWSADFPDDPNSKKPLAQPPGRDTWNTTLQPALTSLLVHRRRFQTGRALKVVAQCHLTMALAFGFAFRRNSGVDLQVIDPYSGNLWLGPASPAQPADDAWTVNRLDVGTGSDLGLAINITQQSDSFAQQMRDATAGSNIGAVLILEPASGPSRTVLNDLDGTDTHRWALAAIEQLEKDPNFPNCTTVHLYFVGPPGLAILLAQQLSNVCAVQTYEWSQARRDYLPGCLLVSS